MSENGEHLTFEPSAQLKQARELTAISESSGHPRPMLDYAGLYTFFDVLEQEERKVFDLQISLGRLAVQLDRVISERDAARQAAADFAVGGANNGRKDRGAYALLRELVAPTDSPVPSRQDLYVCATCHAEGESVDGVEHESDCVISRARELVDGD